MIPFGTETITKISRKLIETDRNDLIPIEDEQTVITGCNIQPGATSEDEELRDTATVRWTVWCPPATPISHGDLVEYQGRRYQVHGDPEVWQSPTGALAHRVVYLVDWDG